MARHAAVTGWGHYLPQRVLTNRDLEALLDTTDEWVVTRTGIRERHIAAPDETTASMCARAAERALARSRLAAEDIDLLICATTTPDYLLPATACLVQKRLGAVNAGAFDLNAACSGSLAALTAGAQFILAGTCRRVLVVAGETLSRFLDWQDRTTCILHGDGAAAVVLEAAQQGGLLAPVLGCSGDDDGLLRIEAGGSARPASAATVAAGEHRVRMRGNELFRLAVRGMAQAAAESLARAGLAAEGLHAVIPHQANLRIIRAVQEALGLPAEKVFINIDRRGNTGSAALPLALSEYLSAAEPSPGDDLLLVSFGGGLAWAAAVLRWVDVEAVIAARPARGGRRAGRFVAAGAC